MKKVKNNKDTRVIRTKKAFTDAFFLLLKSKAAEDIKVADIIEKANYSKQAFYTHYDSKEDFINKIIAEDLDKLENIINTYILNHPHIENSYEEVKELHKLIFQYTFENKRNIFYHFESCFENMPLGIIALFQKIKMPLPFYANTSCKNYDYLKTISSYHLNAVLGYWLETRYELPLDYLLNSYVDIAYGKQHHYPLYGDDENDFEFRHRIIQTPKIKEINIKTINSNSTKQLFITTFLKMLENRETITLDKLINKTGYSKTTFYKYFKSIDYLINEMMNAEILLLIKTCRSNIITSYSKENIENFLLPFFNVIYQRKNQYATFFKYDIFITFTNKLLSCLDSFSILLAPKNDHIEIIDPFYPKVVSSYLLFGTIQWFVLESNTSPENITKLFVDTFYI